MIDRDEWSGVECPFMAISSLVGGILGGMMLVLLLLHQNTHARTGSEEQSLGEFRGVEAPRVSTKSSTKLLTNS